MEIQVKRAYEKAAANDGFRVLVDRLWPRGVRKVDHDVARWAEFRLRYKIELDTLSEPVLTVRRSLPFRDNSVRLARLSRKAFQMGCGP
jgi:uncharacterized protein YeaO (DUF488 family)